MKRLWCRLVKHRKRVLTQRQDMPYVIDGEAFTADLYEVYECVRCGLLEEFALVLLDDRETVHGLMLVSMLERRELACLEDAQAWNKELGDE